VTTASECEAVDGAVMELRARETVLSQKRVRLRSETEVHKQEMKTLHLAIRYVTPRHVTCDASSYHPSL
jgi:hypothetical protein